MFFLIKIYIWFFTLEVSENILLHFLLHLINQIFTLSLSILIKNIFDTHRSIWVSKVVSRLLHYNLSWLCRLRPFRKFLFVKWEVLIYRLKYIRLLCWNRYRVRTYWLEALRIHPIIIFHNSRRILLSFWQLLFLKIIFFKWFDHQILILFKDHHFLNFRMDPGVLLIMVVDLREWRLVVLLECPLQSCFNFQTIGPQIF